MRVLFLNPIIFYRRWPVPADFTRFSFNPPSVTFPQIAACLPSDVSVDFWDGTVERFNYRKFITRLANVNLVAISCNCGAVSLNTELSIRLIKKIDPRIIVVVGGLHASVYPDAWLARGADYVVRGEGEQTFAELIASLKAGSDINSIRGVSYQNDGAVRSAPDRPFIDNLDELPMPRWDLLDLKKYNTPFNKGFIATVETSRGCAFQCSFCVVSVVWRKTQRFKSITRVIDELKQLKALGVRRICIADDNFGYNYDRDMQLLEEMIRQKLHIRWFGFARADFVYTHPEFYSLAARAGLECVLTGFETLKQNSLVRFNKGYGHELTIDEYGQVYSTLKKNKIFTVGLFIAGYPEESEEDLRYTMLHYNRVCDFPLFTPFRPEKSTATYNMLRHEFTEEPFYYDSQIRLGSYDRYKNSIRFLTVMVFFRSMIKVFSSDKFTRIFHCNLYRHLMVSLVQVNFRCLRDFYYLVFVSSCGIPYDYFKEKIVDRYLKLFK